MRSLLLLLFTALVLFCTPTDKVTMAQSEQLNEMELIDRVSQLQDQLDAEQMSQRDEAEAELIKVGPMALDHLDDPTDDMPLDKVERLARIRKKLETVAVRSASKPSTITLNGSLTAEESLRQITRQTGNDIAFGDNVSIEAGQSNINWAGKSLSFWEAITQIQESTGLTIDPYAADGSKLRLVPVDPETRAFMKQNPAVQATSDMFHVQVTRVDAARNLTHANLDHVSLQLLIRWEPRLRPISLKMPANSVKAIGADQKAVAVLQPESVFSGMVQPQIPQLQLTVPLESIPRSVEQIESLTATIEATLPGRSETFRFRRVGKLPAGKKIARAGATVTFEGIDKNEDLFGITISLEFDEESNALESHQSWVFDNPMYLEDQQGERLTPLTYETIRQDNNRVAVTYYFADDPGERTLVYQTPAAILQTKSKIELINIPLP